jgi:hypothetical protein
MKADRQATEAMHFINPKSYVAKDGRHVLLGKEDWDIRKLELWKRANGRCEHTYMAGRVKTRCSAVGCIPAHVKPRYPLRDDRLENLKLYCMTHDAQNEKQAWRRIRSDKKERSERLALGCATWAGLWLSFC